MAISESRPQAEDLFSVGTRISWGAILGGGLVALALYFMFSTLGAAVGLSISDRVRPDTLKVAAVVWTILTLCIALFVGAVMTSMFTVGENNVESVFYGVIMWAFVVGAFLFLGTAGVRTGFSAMNHLAHAEGTTWDLNVRDTVAKANDPQTQPEMKDAATRVAWYAFGGTWLSMLAAAAGSWIGAGPTFRIVTVEPRPRTIQPRG